MSTPPAIKKIVQENKSTDTPSVRISLYNLIYKVANGNEKKISELYRNLYHTYKVLYDIDLQKLTESSACRRVVDYAVQYGHIEKLFSLARKIFESEVDK